MVSILHTPFTTPSDDLSAAPTCPSTVTFLATTPLHALHQAPNNPEWLPPAALTPCYATLAPESIRLQQIEALRYFLTTAPTTMSPNESIQRHALPNDEQIACVLWQNLFHITGTDILRSLIFRFEAFGRPVANLKKFEEGVFSDLRNLKTGTDATLEGPKSDFLDLLYKNNCIRTQKKQKVYYWFSVPHDKLFVDALERDLRRERRGIAPTTIALAEPALSISGDLSDRSFLEFKKAMLGEEGILGRVPKVRLDACCEETEDAEGRAYEDEVAGRLSSVGSDECILGLDGSPAPGSTPTLSASSSSPSPAIYSSSSSRIWDEFTTASAPRDAHSPAPSSLYSLIPPLADAQRPKRRRMTISDPTRYDGDGPCPNFAEPRPFVCPFEGCRRPFKRLQHWKRHIRSSHSDVRPYECPYCQKAFTRSDSLTVHKKTHFRNPSDRAMDKQQRRRGLSLGSVVPQPSLDASTPDADIPALNHQHQLPSPPQQQQQQQPLQQHSSPTRQHDTPMSQMIIPPTHGGDEFASMLHPAEETMLLFCGGSNASEKLSFQHHLHHGHTFSEPPMTEEELKVKNRLAMKAESVEIY
ncbi:uncharacterized protein VTP21DRAFT_7601 [Calcarisporiella thermophila]|uniref:uncharacterized protein n=1 Tax=Calcarisporiella thermophila TaxID=911321 RepID=UPI00374449E7